MKGKPLPFRLHLSVGYRKLSGLQRGLYMELWLVSDTEHRLPDDIDWLMVSTGNDMRVTRFREAIETMVAVGLLERDGGELVLTDPHATKRVQRPGKSRPDGGSPADSPRSTGGSPAANARLADGSPVADAGITHGTRAADARHTGGSPVANARPVGGSLADHARIDDLNDSVELDVPLAGASARAFCQAKPGQDKPRQEGGGGSELVARTPARDPTPTGRASPVLVPALSQPEPEPPAQPPQARHGPGLPIGAIPGSRLAEPDGAAFVEAIRARVAALPEDPPADPPEARPGPVLPRGVPTGSRLTEPVWAAFVEAVGAANEAGHRLEIQAFTAGSVHAVLAAHPTVDPLAAVARLRTDLTGKLRPKPGRAAEIGDGSENLRRICEWTTRDGGSLPGGPGGGPARNARPTPGQGIVERHRPDLYDPLYGKPNPLDNVTDEDVRSVFG